jgi:Cys-rich protein (TIGR01571 family)
MPNYRRPNLVEASEDDDYSQLTTATRREDYEENYEGPCIIRVIAPATLEEGYTFDVLVDDEPYTVQVPLGGVKEGQEFEVEYNPNQEYQYHRGTSYRKNMERLAEGDDEDGVYVDDEESDIKVKPTRTMSREESQDEQDIQSRQMDEEATERDSKTTWFDRNGAPIGAWRTSLCSCCNVFTQSTWWMGFICTPILVAQIIDRMKLTWTGRPGTKEETALSYNRILLSMIFVLAFFWVPVLGWILVFGFYAIVVVLIGSNVRAYMRQKYKIPARLPFRCGQYIDDLFFMLFCGCCSTIQMARHTHDDKDYPGHGCTTTGLGPDAPEIV